MKSMKICSLLLICSSFFGSMQSLHAQSKFKPPVLLVSIGDNKDSVATVAGELAIQLIAKPLVVTDAKNGKYSITNYQCLYRRKGVTEDEETGKVSPVTSIVAQRFSTTPLPEVWIRTISEQLKPGEEILFFDIIVKDDKGRIMYAPNLKLSIQ